MGILSRSEMEQAINAGGSVLYGGRLYTRIADLPNDAQLAAGDPEKETAAANAMQQQIATLQAQYEQLLAAQQAAGRGRGPSGGQPATDLAPEIAEKLSAAGYGTPEAIAAASDEQLLAVEGIGPATVKRLRAAAVKTS